ncbi:acyl-CoA dehydrogenase family protein [Halioxenophilus sp. WMMB6]|uniref:acyl-CoA dehydrogenase family protein n=1 Tax=Halioxenophilus sp. WMMB6 TaxID=3073815 RepID=UPI00295F0B83|nr:acyl-CoA dehydrogenase family protein [Halioxenophilus sp. WMMB6]
MLKRTVYNEEHEMFREAFRRFLETEAVPHHDEWEERGIVPREFWLKAGEQGALCPQVPEEYGGVGGDYRYLAVVNEAAASAGITGVNFAVHSDIVSGYLLAYGTEDQKQAWLPRMVSGEVLGAIAMTEPGTGSDLQGIRTTARREGNEYVINGSKTFITAGQLADLVIVVAKTDPELGAKGISLILVEGDRPGFQRGKNLDKIGLKAQDTSELFFDDVRVPVTNLLGEEGRGFAQLMKELPQERLAIAVVAMASSQRAFDLTLQYVKDRRAFGKTVFDFQNTRHLLAQLKSEIEVGWAFLDKCIEAHRVGELEAHEASMAKLWSSELQNRVVDRCLQLHGGYGYMREYPIAKMFVDSRIQTIYGGTSEIMREIISRTL